ncbi:hypothetical protein HPB52_007738 [Rhipicephalus sanguineus]|uniref:FAST kinase leucine-rich domain-containing protein n=1 Tax=Rhipicephalus sanguineus TaxID=34632 RepID=A0A9D4PQU5_RHISA|nr:hypothetical protein HPB52_007738 [Rhipicephalus sanguineus]
MEQRVVEHLRTVVRERLSEARTVKDIVWLLETAEHMGAVEHRRKFVLEVQDRALQLVISLPHSDVRLLVRTLARLKLRPTPLLQAAAFYLSKGPKYMPECSDQLFPMLLEELSQEHFTTMPAVWLDIVWSLAALGKVQQTHLDSVLQPHFYTPLLGE